MIGKVSFYNRAKGWGFAIPSNNTRDVFLHCSNMPASHAFVREGDTIEYELGERNGRPLAINIHVIQEAPHQEEPQPATEVTL